ncbi:uncharacterized protein ISCGN_029786 [Ixodes scapularis]
MVMCCVPRCQSEQGKTSVSFHQFPVDNKLKLKWIAAITHGDPPTFRAFHCTKVCGLHFRKDDIFTHGSSKRRVRAGAVPTLFLPKNGASGPDHSASSSQQPFPVKLTASATRSDECAPLLHQAVVSVGPAADSAETITPSMEHGCSLTVLPKTIKREITEPVNSATEVSSSESAESILPLMEPNTLKVEVPSIALPVATSKAFHSSSESVSGNDESAAVPTVPRESCTVVQRATGIKRGVQFQLPSSIKKACLLYETKPGQCRSLGVTTGGRKVYYPRQVSTKSSGVQVDSLHDELRECRNLLARAEREKDDLRKQVLRAETKLVTLDRDPTYQAFRAVTNAASSWDPRYQAFGAVTNAASAQFILDQLLSFNKERPTWHESTVSLCATWRHVDRKGYEHARACGLLSLPSSATLARYNLPP